MSASNASNNDGNAPTTLESAVEQAKRAFALRKYEQAVDFYTTALEFATVQYGEDAPETADLYFSYGRALLENAITSNVANEPILSFSGDAEEEDPTVDLFANAGKAVSEEKAAVAEEAGEEDEPEDDFNAAWEVLDLARAIYDRQVQQEGDDEVKLKLADTYIALGDVSLETEKFDQASQDYEAGLKYKIGLLPTSSRQIAEAHYKLNAISHAQNALESVELRLAELRDGLAGQLSPLPEEPPADPRGKGKAVAKLARDDVVQKMSKQRIESEVKELSELRDDLALKVEELKTSPNDALARSAPALAAQALDKELNARVALSGLPQSVNDLTGIVKKKKKVPASDANAGATSSTEASGAKRKAEDEAEESNTEKKARIEES
ncbi:NASP-related protein sim3 [Leucoagaricus sp. SymC.cos]|nr:NASP-related protein sim3 [Leucoagaricus sp. SymC.cos]